MHFTTEFLLFCDIVGTIAFGISGALIAIESDMDLSGAVILAFVTGNGGGTIRDLILGSPVFWTVHPVFIVLSLVSGTGIFFLYYYFPKPIKSRLFITSLNFVDMLGLIAFTVGGTAKALDYHQLWIVAIMMGALTAVGGGVIRDVLARKIPEVFRGQLYLTPAIVGACFFVLLEQADTEAAVLSAGISIVFLRLMSILFNWHLPMIKHKN
jgi:uncharacterized membrane protein YeiH